MKSSYLNNKGEKHVMQVEVEPLANVHTHLREGEAVKPLIQWAITGGADVLGPMPNTEEGLTRHDQVLAYIQRAGAMVPSGSTLKFLPIAMLTEATTENDIDGWREAGIVDAKVYPKDRTTKSHNGVSRYGRIIPQVRHCGKVGVKVHFHPEHPSMNFNNRDAEFAFVPLAYMFLEETDATIIWEHGTDGRCVLHWIMMAQSDRFFVTLTAHHLATNEDQTFGDVSAVCKPPIKTEYDREHLIRLVGLDFPWVMAGLDDAFHDISKKHVPSGRCQCGAYTAPFGLPLYAHALGELLETPAGVKTFVNFTSRNARGLHKLPPASRAITLLREPQTIPLVYQIGLETAIPFWAGQSIDWQIAK